MRHPSRRVDDSTSNTSIDRASVQTVPVVCMHCEQPTCAEVCPADAIKRTGDGVVSRRASRRCIACGNCVLACPFGVPEVYEDRQIMMKCDMCYDRSSGREKADVRHRLPEPGAVLRHPRADRANAPHVHTDQHFSIRQPDGYDPGLRDGAKERCDNATLFGCDRGDG